MQLVIGISGVPGVGKDEIAGELVRRHEFFRVAFADAIRLDMVAINPIVVGSKPLQELVGRTANLPKRLEYLKREYPRLRELYQNYGARCREVWGKDCWIRRLEHKAKGHPLVVIPDVRYPNELDWIRSKGGHLWYVTRPGFMRVNNHESEGYYKQLEAESDARIGNDGDLASLYETAGEVLRYSFAEILSET